jgi:hypothetical protein
MFVSTKHLEHHKSVRSRKEGTLVIKKIDSRYFGHGRVADYCRKLYAMML